METRVDRAIAGGGGHRSRDRDLDYADRFIKERPLSRNDCAFIDARR